MPVATVVATWSAGVPPFCPECGLDRQVALAAVSSAPLAIDLGGTVNFLSCRDVIAT